MENQDIKWETWEEQPQENWDAESQQENIPTWGEQPQENVLDKQENPSQENNSSIHGKLSNKVNNQITLRESRKYNTPTPLTNKENYIKLESLTPINSKLKQYSFNNIEPSLILKDILNHDLIKIDNDGKFTINSLKEGETTKLLNNIKEIGNSLNLNLKNIFILKNSPKESSLNIIKGNSAYNFIYFLNPTSSSGDIILDLSHIKGPSLNIPKKSHHNLILIPGWIPFRITKNLSDQDILAISGNFQN